MRTCILTLLAGLLLSANAMAAITFDHQQARNMDDVQSLGVIYINHNNATESEAGQPQNEKTSARDAQYGHVLLIQEPETQRISADFYH